MSNQFKAVLFRDVEVNGIYWEQIGGEWFASRKLGPSLAVYTTALFLQDYGGAFAVEATHLVKVEA